MTACVLNSVIDLETGTVTRAFKQHVFEYMGNPRTQPFAFVNAPGSAPALNRHNRRRIVSLYNDLQPIG